MALNKSENYRDRIHCLLLYPDCDNHKKAIETIERSYDYALILHDRDIQEDGTLKKLHYHIVVKFPQARWKTAICKELGIEENYIEKPRNFINALMYLIHYNDTDKAQYNIDDVKGSLKSRLVQEISKIDKTEDEKISELFEYIHSSTEVITITEFSYYCTSIGYWAIYRRAYSIFKDMIYEHNMMIRGNDNDYTREF